MGSKVRVYISDLPLDMSIVKLNFSSCDGTSGSPVLFHGDNAGFSATLSCTTKSRCPEAAVGAFLKEPTFGGRGAGREDLLVPNERRVAFFVAFFQAQPVGWAAFSRPAALSVARVE